MYVLEVMSGPLDGTRWHFDHEIIIGRDEAVAGACIAFDRYLSRSHARLEAVDGRLHVSDLTSRNGTTVAGQVVTEEYLDVGQRFTCGRTLLCVMKADDVEGEPTVVPRAAGSLETITSNVEMRRRRPLGIVGFVPTMGALHAGHLALVERAQSECDSVVASIFVNPLQFAAGEDFDRYPREPERDVTLLADHGVSVLFAPALGTFYDADFSTSVDVGDLGSVYEGASRPGHFRGVATVVTKLLNIVQPTRMYIGQKDAQQIAVLKRLVRDLEMKVEIVVVPTDRESDGLARSSRNVYLSTQERRRAPVLYHALTTTAAAFRHGASREEAVAVGCAQFAASDEGENLDEALSYLDIVHPLSFLPVPDVEGDRNEALVIAAFRLGSVRLIDNVRVSEA